MKLPWVRQSMYDQLQQHFREILHDMTLGIRRLEAENGMLLERSRQTADRFAEAIERAEKAEDFARRLTASMVKLKMAGGNLPDPARQPRVWGPPPDDETIARRRSDEEFVEGYVKDAVAVGASVEEARDEAERIRKEVMDGVPGV